VTGVLRYPTLRPNGFARTCVARIPYPPLTSGYTEHLGGDLVTANSLRSLGAVRERPVTACGIAVRAIIAHLPAASAPLEHSTACRPGKRDALAAASVPRFEHPYTGHPRGRFFTQGTSVHRW